MGPSRPLKIAVTCARSHVKVFPPMCDGAGTALSIAALLAALAGVVADLACDSSARARMTNRLQAGWSKLGEGSLLASLCRTHEIAEGFMTRVLGTPRAPIRLITSIVVATTLIAALCLVVSTLAMGQNLRDTFSRAISYYAAPTIAAGACALGALYYQVRCVARVCTPTRLLATLLALVFACVLLWFAAMHAGTWHEWQFRRSPLEYGSAWFYAEVYHEYFTGGIGSAVSLALSMVLALAIGLHLLMLSAVTLLKMSAPVAGPATVALAKAYQCSSRGAGAAIIVAILAGSVVVCGRPSLGAPAQGRYPPRAPSVVVPHVRPWVGDEAFPVRHHDFRQGGRVDLLIFSDDVRFPEHIRGDCIDLVVTERARLVEGHRSLDIVEHSGGVRPVALDGLHGLTACEAAAPAD